MLRVVGVPSSGVSMARAQGSIPFSLVVGQDSRIMTAQEASLQNLRWEYLNVLWPGAQFMTHCWLEQVGCQSGNVAMGGLKHLPNMSSWRVAPSHSWAPHLLLPLGDSRAIDNGQ